MLPIEPDLPRIGTGPRAASPPGLDRRVAAVGTDDHAERPARFGSKLQAAALEQIDGPFALDHDRPDNPRAQGFLGHPQPFQRRLHMNERHRVHVEQPVKAVWAEHREMPTDDPQAGAAKLTHDTGSEDARGGIAGNRRHDLMDPARSQRGFFVRSHCRSPTVRMRPSCSIIVLVQRLTKVFRRKNFVIVGVRSFGLDRGKRPALPCPTAARRSERCIADAHVIRLPMLPIGFREQKTLALLSVISDGLEKYRV